MSVERQVGRVGGPGTSCFGFLHALAPVWAVVSQLVSEGPSDAEALGFGP